MDWDVVLSYLFRTSSSDKSKVPPLQLDELLLPPLLIDPGCWRLGYLETVSHQLLGLGDALGRHCFRDALPVAMGRTAVYVDEHGRRLDRRFEPCGDYGMVPAVGLDRQVRKALGLPLSPD